MSAFTENNPHAETYGAQLVGHGGRALRNKPIRYGKKKTGRLRKHRVAGRFLAATQARSFCCVIWSVTRQSKYKLTTDMTAFCAARDRVALAARTVAVSPALAIVVGLPPTRKRK